MNLEILKAKSIENWRNRTQMHSNKISGPLCLVSFLGSRCMDSVWVRIGYIFSTYSSNLLRWEIFNATQNVLCFSLPHFHMGSKQLWIFLHVYGHMNMQDEYTRTQMPFIDFISRLWLVALEVVFLWHRLI